eukprot:XP_011448379.2 PREDICTED: uncharacterized protein LOC105342943 [Crassostrea gigas]
MFLDKIHLALYLIFVDSVLIIYCQLTTHSSEMCLKKALTIHRSLKAKNCPLPYLEAKTDRERCSVSCNGSYTKKEPDPHRDCVGFNIKFKLEETLITYIKVFPCEIPNCSLEVVNFECTLNRSHTEFTDGEKRSCIDPGSSAVIILCCLVGGSLIGISAFVLVKRLRTYHRRLQPPPVFYQPNYGDSGDLQGDSTVTIGSPLETEYADIEETIRMVAKAIQVPSYKEDSSSETRSRENIYHHLSLTEDSTKRENSAILSNDCIPDNFADDVNLSNKGSPSFKSVVICADSSSSKSNGNSKVSPTGSVGSDKYYALEKEYVIFNSSNGNK